MEENTNTEILHKCNFDPKEIIDKQIPIVEKMVQDEQWYLGEKIHRTVNLKEIELKIEKIIMESGHKMREEAIEKIKKEKCINDCNKCKWYLKNII